MTELQRIAERYARRADRVEPDRYSLLRPDVWQLVQERQRWICRGLAARGWQPADLRLVEVGCGGGGSSASLVARAAMVST